MSLYNLVLHRVTYIPAPLKLRPYGAIQMCILYIIIIIQNYSSRICIVRVLPFA